MKSRHAIQGQQGGRQRCPQQDGYRQPQDKNSRGTRPLSHWKPQADIQNHAREKSSFCDAEQKAHDIERGRALYECHAGSNQTPGDHDSCDPEPGADAMENEIAWNFEQKVSNEENTCAETVDSSAEPEVIVHL